ncbi:zinc-binding dehydrogenase [Lentilactobacillus otakiensis]|uniref:Zn-dependent dehydrogenase n=1 Tax=Lentilactobacillus otakiensis DSM 19908 = JCM 15040 TaxID=1423780 RepID=S4NSW7_9LACO|nr:zinc-binding dehydrogenase [Lentilactobacillus otakiensis]MBZ3776526.1 zinc-binding dehydrogenase [Lentilactobacillus otakiensis]MDV3517375.1 zinc-binding dehydrogenase [Lentilactobacillus otakiensis]GAD17073.1 zn-dependent dehydrogenase [Lentilactobacillus otakiensis DSM 19908 = JCM 15040]
MKGVIYKGIHDIEVEELPMPEPTDNDIVVKVMRNGICGSDLHAYNLGGDEIGVYPGAAIGHEFVGIVTTVGKNVINIKPDDHVFINPSIAKKNPGMLAMAGGLSQYNLIENATINKNVFELPKDLPFDRAVVIEPYSVGIHGKNLAHPDKTMSYCIFGAGPVGLAAASGLLMQGITDVVVVDIDDKRLQFAANLGAKTINSSDTNLHDNLISLFGSGKGLMGDQRVGVDVYIDCVGIPTFINDVITFGKFGAKFIVVALGDQPVTFKPQFLAMNEISLIGSAIYTPIDIKEAISNIKHTDNPFPEIVSVHYPLEQSREAFDRANTDKTMVKVVIDVNE